MHPLNLARLTTEHPLSPILRRARRIPFRDKLKKHSIGELENLAEELHSKYYKITAGLNGAVFHWDEMRPGFCRTWKKPDEFNDLLGEMQKAPLLLDVLEERQFRMNDDFKFTPEAVSRLVEINGLLSDCLEKARRETWPLIQELGREIDYNASLIIHPCEIDEFVKSLAGTSVQLLFRTDMPDHYETLEDFTDDWNKKSGIMTRTASCFHDYYKNDGQHEDLYNYNLCSGLNHPDFEKHHICYAMHELCNHTLWSFRDILEITQVAARVTVIDSLSLAHVSTLLRAIPF